MPDYILLTGRSSPAYGANYFGIDYGQKICHWIESSYHVTGEFGRFRSDDAKRPPTPTAEAIPTLAALLYEKEGPDHDDQTR